MHGILGSKKRVEILIKWTIDEDIFFKRHDKALTAIAYLWEEMDLVRNYFFL